MEVQEPIPVAEAFQINWLTTRALKEAQPADSPIVASDGGFGRVDKYPKVLSYWGAIKGDRLELSYGENHEQEGTVSLRFIKNERAAKGTLRFLNNVPLPPGAEAWIEIDGKRTTDWQVGRKELSMPLEPGAYRVAVYSTFKNVQKTCYDDKVTIRPGPPTNIRVGLVGR